MQTGSINVQTENIFPIIKKFLYSDHEIFLRELISNAVDATQKLKTLASVGDFKGELGDITIEVKLDAKKKTLTVSDKGIGMTSEEVEKYINQIAFSGAEEFVKKFKDQPDANAMIGHFGMGFYSSFMVAEKVEIISKSYKKGPRAKAVRWECTGNPDYLLEEIDKKDRGTDIVLHIGKDSEEFLEEYRVLNLLQKYCKFLPVPIQFGTEKHTEKNEKDKEVTTEVPRIINNTEPAWTKKPSDLTLDNYKDFYRELYPMNFEEPLFHIHLNVDYPFNLTGILYFPKVKKNLEVQRDKIQLYCNQVFVTDSVEGIVPDFLTLLHGVIDSPDIPLNVSRSYLQSDPNVKKISSHISKKVADKLEELFKSNRSDYEEKWDNIKVFIEYGMISDEKFYERATKFFLLKNTDGKYFTIDEYKEFIKITQEDKDKNLVWLYTSNADEQHVFMQPAKERGYDILLMDGVLDGHFISHVERKFEKTKFTRIDSDILDKLITKEDVIPSKLTDEEKEKLKPVFEAQLSKDKFNIVFENMSESEQPVLVTQPEFMRRMREMSAMGGNSFYGAMPETYNVVVNVNHSITSKIINEPDVEKQSKLVKQITDLALLSQNLLKGEELTNFIKRSVDMIE